MSTLVMPTKPRYAEAIRRGEKTSELRRRILKGIEPGDTVALYETAPVSKVTTEFKVLAAGYSCADTDAEAGRVARRGAVSLSAARLYETAHEGAGPLTMSSIRIGEVMVLPGSVRKFKEPRPVSDYGLSCAPQGCCWARKEPEREGGEENGEEPNS